MLDQASEDDTVEWLFGTDATVIPLEQNVGLTPGLNMLLDCLLPFSYDVVVRWDNDCELTQPDTLKTVCEAALEHGWILAPHVQGLRAPPGRAARAMLGEYLVCETVVLGGIFMAIPADLFTDAGYRFDETQPLWGGDELITSWYRSIGGHCGYLMDYQVNHYETTDGQHQRYPGYFQRRVLEGGPV